MLASNFIFIFCDTLLYSFFLILHNSSGCTMLHNSSGCTMLHNSRGCTLLHNFSAFTLLHSSSTCTLLNRSRGSILLHSSSGFTMLNRLLLLLLLSLVLTEELAGSCSKVRERPQGQWQLIYQTRSSSARSHNTVARFLSVLGLKQSFPDI